jgi:hypothetical protein
MTEKRNVMLLKMFFRLIPMLALSLLLTGCPTVTSTNNGRMNLGGHFSGGRDNALGDTVDRICQDANGMPKRNCDINDINTGRHMNGANPCDDGNCPKPHQDRTPSIPSQPIANIPGATTITFEQGQKAKSNTWIHDKQTGRTTSLLGPPPRQSTRDCGQGVKKLVKALYGDDIQGHGYMWFDKLNNHPKYKPVSCEPESCPPGAILVYDHHQPNPINNGGGDQYGHVEVAMPTADGKVQACSDYCSNNFGGNARRRALFKGAFVRVQ